MGEITGIAWCDHTFNPWRGCTKVSAGCADCYAELMAARNPAVLGEWGPQGKRAMAAESYWRQPVRWNAAAQKAGVRRKVFTLSLGDALEDRPELAAPRERLVALIKATPWLDWLLLTKRTQNLELLFDVLPFGAANLWLGCSIESQEYADRAAELIRYPAQQYFISHEPAIGPLEVASLPQNVEWWIISGGKAHSKRDEPTHPDWLRAVRDDCAERGWPWFFKQWGDWIPRSHLTPWKLAECNKAKLPWGTISRWLEGGHWQSHFYPLTTPWNGHDDDGNNEAVMYRVGAKTAGATLDGREWRQFP